MMMTMSGSGGWRRSLGAACAFAWIALAAATARPASAADALLEPIAGSAADVPAPWKVVGLPQQKKPFTRFAVVEVDGRRAVRIEAEQSYGNLVHPLANVGAAGALHLRWRWRIEQPLAGVDLREKSGDDTEVKVCVFFDEPMDNVPFADRQVLRFARSKSAEPVPSATVCYVRDAQLAVGTVLESPFTGRVRYFVVEGGAARLNQWSAHRRDVAADFKKAFGAESPQVPPITGVAVGADADNTKGHSISYVSELVLER